MLAKAEGADLVYEEYLYSCHLPSLIIFSVVYMYVDVVQHCDDMIMHCLLIFSKMQTCQRAYKN